MEFKKRWVLLLLLLFSLGSSFYILTTDEIVDSNDDELDIKVSVDSSDEDVGWLLDMELNAGDEETTPSTKTPNADESGTSIQTDISEDEANGEADRNEELGEEANIETDEEVTEKATEDTEKNRWWEKWLLLLTNMFEDEDTEEVEPVIVETTTSSSSGYSSKVNFTYTDKTNEELEAMMNATVEESMVTVSMATNPVFENGVGEVLIYNDISNKYPQIVEINTTSGTLIYQSGLIAVGSKVETATLLVDLATGNHNCIATFNVIDGDTGELIARVNAKIVVTVK